MTRTCILDVGANGGDFLFPVAARLPDMPIIGFEPIPELFDKLVAKREVLKVPHVHLEKLAIDTTPGKAVFNVARHADWGVSSLLNFNQQTLKENEYWSTRSDLFFEDQIEVEVVRLDAVLGRLGFEHVSFLKIDAQGVDLRVLASLGSLLPTVDGGMLEAPTTRDAILYGGEPVLRDVLNFLEEHGFDVYGIKANDPACSEVNIFFVRKGLDFREMERRLQLRGIPLYDGRHYWHIPSASPALPPGDAVSQSILQELTRARHCTAENAAAWTQVTQWKARVAALEERVKQLESEHTLARHVAAQNR